jgi:Fe-S cluster biogenesis protein NfuA/nitrite reductase/ring-hydroxylating ferredoxin subunit
MGTGPHPGEATATEAHPGELTATEAHPGELLDRIQDLSDKVDRLSDVRARMLAQELVASVIAMYGDGLRRIMDVIAGSHEEGATILDELSQDGAVASLLLIHDLYPVSLRDRVIEALDTVRPYMESHGGNVELVELEDGVARLLLQGSCNGCSASRATLELAIKQALEEHAPDLTGLEVEGVTEPAPAGGDGIALPMASTPAPASAPAMAPERATGDGQLPIIHSGDPQVPATDTRRPPRWVTLEESVRPAPGELREVDIDGAAVLFADVGASLLAYENQCAACGEPLGRGELDGGMLRCPSCEVEFDLPRAGRAAGGEPLQLRPVPLLESGGLRVAV